MKKLILIIAIFIVGSFCAEAQSITDYNQKAVSNKRLTYDQYWYPTLTFSLKNLSNKAITNVEIIIWYHGYSEVDFTQPTTTCRTSTIIYPGYNGILSFRFDCGNRQPKGFTITRIRYADGTVCQSTPSSYPY